MLESDNYLSAVVRLLSVDIRLAVESLSLSCKPEYSGPETEFYTA
jgi:hypothetical protein